MQPEAGVVGSLLAIAFILGTAVFRSLSERSGQVPASTLTNSVANDPLADIQADEGSLTALTRDESEVIVGLSRPGRSLPG
jgi:hypothetical protein